MMLDVKKKMDAIFESAETLDSKNGIKVLTSKSAAFGWDVCGR